MGTIKDIVDLTTQLADRVEDRKFATDLFQIIRLINTVQSDQTILIEKNHDLMSDKSQMEQTISSLKAKITTLQNQITKLQTPTKNEQADLSTEERDILQFLAKNKAGEAPEISAHIDLDLTKVEYWLEELENKNNVFGTYIMGSPVLYQIDQKGRKFLIENNLI